MFSFDQKSVSTGHPKNYLFNVEAEAGKDQARHPYKSMELE
jgi:hypothetical protein